MGGKPLQTTLDEKKKHVRIHERLMELLATVHGKVFGSVAPGRIVELYAAWNAPANLTDAAGTVSVRAQAASDKGFDHAGIENGVLEPLHELGLIDDDHADRG